MFRSVLIFLVLALGQVALGSLLPGTLSKSTFTTTKCVTRLSTASRLDAVPTKSSTVTLLPLITALISTSTPSTTTTPPVSTSIVYSTNTVSTTVTASTITDTFTTTSTVFFTTTASPTTTSTVTSTFSTTATTVVTSIIPAPSGFQSVTDTAGESSQVKRDVSHPHGSLESRSAPQQCPGPNKFSFAVTCKAIVQVRYTEVFIKKSPTTTTITAQTPVITSTSTITSTSVITVVPPHITNTQSTSTISLVTITSSQTVVVTVPTTQTATLQSTTTVYAACATPNILGPTLASGQTIGTVVYNSGVVVQGIAQTPYDCCVLCQTDGTCATSVFDNPDQLCYLLDGVTCNSGQSSTPVGTYAFLENAAGSSSDVFTVSNGPCGVLIEEV